ncbi:unnamed protein product [Schistosoma intercalatum]|nr:unnamed protein product [Schistosoma intercalatum]
MAAYLQFGHPTSIPALTQVQRFVWCLRVPMRLNNTNTCLQTNKVFPFEIPPFSHFRGFYGPSRGRGSSAGRGAPRGPQRPSYSMEITTV